MAERDERPDQPLRLPGGFVVRVLVLLPVIATMGASLALMVYGLFDSWRFAKELLFPGHEIMRDEVLLHAIEIVDLFLLATVMQVVSVGLYQLYFHQDLQLPKWLKIETLDHLKSKLVGVTITVLAVYFLGRALTWQTGADIAYLGIGASLVIAALTWFLSKIDHH